MALKNRLFLMALACLAIVACIPGIQRVDLGPRPMYLVDDMDNSALKTELKACAGLPIKKSDFSIGHRGAPLQFPEHTKESYIAAARMGAGILECDVAFTKDRELVCRHSQCDLHTTTNILDTPLAAKCSEGFTPAEFDANGQLIKAASARCCTSDITLNEFKSLRGKMDAANNRATTVAEYMNGTANWRTDLYSTNGTLMSHRESIQLFKQLDVKMTPELKTPDVAMPYEGEYTQEDYALQLIDEYTEAGVPAGQVFAQSFNLGDVLTWLNKQPTFGKQAVYLDDDVYANAAAYQEQIDRMPEFYAMGIRYIAPPTWILVELDEQNRIIPSEYAKAANDAGLNIITWTLERSGPLATGGGWYYQTVSEATNNDGDVYELLDVLAQDVGVKGVFSDWPATVTYYANCKGL